MRSHCAPIALLCVVAYTATHLAFVSPMATGARRTGLVARAASINEQLAATGPSSISAGKEGPSSFNNLIAALQAAGLTDALNGAGPFTVFAPDDFAFTASGVTAADATAAILKLHVFPGVMKAAEFKNQAVATLGGEVTMKKGRMGVLLNGVAIKKPDITLSNGVMHIMSKVIMPQ
jgi:uncharacterized surface protein with fasciclin (FAS1) repeats